MIHIHTNALLYKLFGDIFFFHLHRLLIFHIWTILHCITKPLYHVIFDVQGSYDNIIGYFINPTPILYLFLIVFFSFSVYKVFENVAQKYDIMNDAMSLGIHRLWKDMLLHAMHPQPGARLLDVAGGTGKTVCVRFCETSN